MRNLYRAALLLCALFGAWPAWAQSYEEEFQKRAGYLTNQVADVYAFSAPGRDGISGSIPDPEKYNWPPTIARLWKYCLDDSVANRRITTFKDNDPFHFTLVGMARIMFLFPDAPALRQHKLTYLREVWNRTDSYNAWTIEGTENHLNMSRTSGYLYAEEMLKYPSEFPAAQVTARRDSMKNWILRMTRQVYMTGNAEWNSSTYEVYNLIGWLNLYDFARDPQVRNAAKAMLDYLTTEIALHYSQGILGGAESRGTASTSVRTGTDYLAWLWFGDAPRNPMVTVGGLGFWSGNDYIQSMHAATSQYRPDPMLVKLARKQLGSGMYYMGRPGYLYDKPRSVRNTFFISPNYTLGATQLPYRGFAGGNSQFTNWKMVARVDTPAGTAVMVAGSGRYWNYWSGRARHPYDQFVHYKNVLIQMTKTPVNHQALMDASVSLYTQWQNQWRTDFTQRFSASDVKLTMGTNGTPIGAQTRNTGKLNQTYVSWPTGYSSVVNNGVTFVNFGKTFMAVRSLKLNNPTAEANEANANRRQVSDTAALGQLVGLVVEFAEASDHASFAAFQTAIIAKNGLDKSRLNQDKVEYTSLQDDVIEADYETDGDADEPLYDWGYGPTSQLVWHASPPFMQPTWPQGAGMGRIPDAEINGAPRTDAPFDVFNGNGLALRNGKLSIHFGNDSTQSLYNPALNNFRTVSSGPQNLGYQRLCESDTARPVLPSQFSPIGIISGTGVTNNALFVPASAGPGIHTISVDINGVVNTKTIEVLAAPPAGLMAARTEGLCASAAPQPMSLNLNLPNPQNYRIQWFRNDTLVDNQTSPTLQVSGSRGARYYAVVRSGCCARQSGTVTVTVNMKPQPSLTNNGGNVVLGGQIPAGSVILWKLPNGGRMFGGNSVPVVNSGFYWAVVDNNGCKDSVSILVNSVKALAASAVRISPNPAHDQLQVELSLPGTAVLQITDLAGKEAAPAVTTSAAQTSLPLGRLPQGTWLLRVQHEQGTLIRRFVKE